MNLKEHLAQTGQTPYSFFKEHGLPRDPVYRAAKGGTVSYRIAERISKATKGAVTISESVK